MIIGLFQMLKDAVFHQSSNQGFLPAVPRNRKDMCSSWLQGSHDFPDCWRDIRQMFEDIGSDDQIKRFIFGKFAPSYLRSETPYGFGLAACLERNEKEDTRDTPAPTCRITGHPGTIHGSSIPAILDKVQQLPTSMRATVGCSCS